MQLKETVKRTFQTASAGFYIGLIAVALAVIGSVAYVLTDYGDRTFSWLIFALILVGAIVYLGAIFTDLVYLPLGSAILFSVGTAYQIYLALPTLSDIWNNVNFIGGNTVQAVVFSIVFLLCTIGAIVSCFTKSRKIAE